MKKITINEPDLPVVKICDISFYIDSAREELREVTNSDNVIPVRLSRDDFSELVFDRSTRNVYQEIIDPDHVPAHVTLVIIPPLNAFEPEECQVKQRAQIDLPAWAGQGARRQERIKGKRIGHF